MPAKSAGFEQGSSSAPQIKRDMSKDTYPLEVERLSKVFSAMSTRGEVSAAIDTSGGLASRVLAENVDPALLYPFDAAVLLEEYREAFFKNARLEGKHFMTWIEQVLGAMDAEGKHVGKSDIALLWRIGREAGHWNNGEIKKELLDRYRIVLQEVLGEVGGVCMTEHVEKVERIRKRGASAYFLPTEYAAPLIRVLMEFQEELQEEDLQLAYRAGALFGMGKKREFLIKDLLQHPRTPKEMFISLVEEYGSSEEIRTAAIESGLILGDRELFRTVVYTAPSTFFGYASRLTDAELNEDFQKMAKRNPKEAISYLTGEKLFNTSADEILDRLSPEALKPLLENEKREIRLEAQTLLSRLQGAKKNSLSRRR